VPRDLQNILDAVLDGIIVLDAPGQVEQINSEACRMLECSPESVARARVEQLLGERHPVAVLARRGLASGRPSIEDDAPVQRRFDGDLEVDVAVSPLQESGQVDGVVVALRDHTVRNSLRELVFQREQLTSYGHIAAGIAHEVKNPLGGIRGAAELVEKRAEDDRTRRTADLIVREVDRITALVDELMVFAKGEELQLRQLNIHRVLDGVIHLLAMDPLGAEIEMERHYDPSIPDLEGDADRLTQVFLNLGRNALQAMEGRAGRLSVSTRMTLHHRLSDAHGRPVPTLAVSVEDAGPGIAPEVLKRLATPFFTTKTQGTGLGLAVSRHWVTRHGGQLGIDSQPGQGTAVRVTLPLKPLAITVAALPGRDPATRGAPS